ncbi:DUF6049 family protein [uncultured Amnibacterium sp.]|uniref:DUF6049 family protein n=1 Tax=uncultured Amnibacterium sp. TaxID=1631851 RepID=UPI0035CBAB42
MRRGAHEPGPAARAAAALAVAAGVLTVVVVPLTGGQSASAAAAPDASTAQVTVAPTDGGVVRAGGTLRVLVEVHNSGTTALPAGRARIGLAQLPPASTATLLQRLHQPAVIAGDLLVGTPRTPAIPAGETRDVRATIAADTLRAVFGSLSGARVLTATLSAAQATSDTGASAVTWVTSDFDARPSFTSVVPFTAPATATGLLTADQLTALTDPATGAWSAELDALRGTDAVIALDPAVPASVRVLGAAAPTQATDFLAGLAALPNEFVPLPYADTDLALTRAAGAPSLPKATSFAGAQSGAESSDTATGATPSATPAPSASATPSTTAPTAAALTSWNYSGGTIAWPADGAVAAGDLRFLRDSTVGAVLIPSAAVNDTAARAAAGPAARLGRLPAILSDTTTTALLNAAVSAGSPTGRAAPLADLMAVLATTSAAADPAALLATVNRGADPATLGRVLHVLAGEHWIGVGSVAALQRTTAAPAVSLRPARAAPAGTGTAHALVTAEAAGRRLLTGVDAAQPLLSSQRLALLGVLSSAWRGDPSGWTSAAATLRRRLDATAGGVHFARNGNVNYYGNTGNLPVRVQNDLAFPVKVTLQGSSDSGRLSVDGDATATLPAKSGPFPMVLPVHSISNGEVILTTTLRTTGGSIIGTPLERRINVAAGWETVGAVVFGVALAALFATGVYRNVVRRRPRGRRAMA